MERSFGTQLGTVVEPKSSQFTIQARVSFFKLWLLLRWNFHLEPIALLNQFEPNRLQPENHLHLSKSSGIAWNQKSFLTLFIDDIIKTSKTQNKGKGPNGPAKKGAAGTRQQPKRGAKSAGNKANAKANQGAAKRNQAGQKPKQNGAQKPKQNQAQKVQYLRPGTLS
jgi:hypothetical protein